MDRRNSAWRQDGTLHALLASLLNKQVDVLKVRELGLVDRRFRPDWQSGADLRHDNANLARRNLHHWMTRHRVDRPQFETKASHQQISLNPASPPNVTGLPSFNFLRLTRLRTSPTSVGPIVQSECQ